MSTSDEDDKLRRLVVLELIREGKLQHRGEQFDPSPLLVEFIKLVRQGRVAEEELVNYIVEDLRLRDLERDRKRLDKNRRQSKRQRRQQASKASRRKNRGR